MLEPWIPAFAGMTIKLLKLIGSFPDGYLQLPGQRMIPELEYRAGPSSATAELN